MVTTRNMTTTTRMGHPVNVYYPELFLRRAMPLMLHAKFGMDYGIPTNEGDTIMWERLANPLALTTPLREGEDPQASQQSVTQIRSTVQEYGGYIKVSSKIDLTAPNGYARQRTGWLSDQHALTIDTLCRDVICASASTTTASKGSPTATMVNQSDIDKITETLLVNKARYIVPEIKAGQGQGTSPALPGFVMLADTRLRNDFTAISGFKYTNQYGQNIKPMEGELGACGDVRVCLTQNGYTSGSNYYCPVIAQEAFGNVKINGGDELLVHLRSDQVASPLKRFSTYGWHCTYAARILNDAWIHVLIATRGARP